MANAADILRRHIDQARRNKDTVAAAELEALLPAANDTRWVLSYHIHTRLAAVTTEVDDLFRSLRLQGDELRTAVRDLDARRWALETFSSALPV